MARVEAVVVSTDKKFLSAEDILSSEDIKVIEVHVPEWGGTIRLRMMSGEEAIRFAQIVEKDKAGSAIKVVAMCAIKEDGTKLFTEDEVELLKKKSLRAIMRLQKKALEINGLSDDGLAEAKND